MFDRIHTQKCESCTNDKKLCCFICGVYENGDREYYNPKLMTNGDRFRNMSDEELALFLEEVHKKRADFFKRCQRNCLGEDCYECWLDWLKQECEE